VKTHKKPGRLPVDVHAALEAIASTGKGRCWYCDMKLPEAAKAMGDGWDVQRIDEHPVASIILVCPECLVSEAEDLPQGHIQVPGTDATRAFGNRLNGRHGNGHGRPILALEPKRA
jgi:hypothetical protein